ncbi:response regulator [Deinococcus enclensis]|uniref:CheY-like chemotaxis protein n=1 Tax=Deinococcus enclensis TaxID=1049582 RepID=A0ABT9MFY7_9DEIO|nr:response regulator [Deinococcus enclensis]MDP9765517.1 CheY-like chemotaxis protein [Deinococcus enclensis]
MSRPLLIFVDDSEADHLLIREALKALGSPVHSQHFLNAGHFLSALDSGTVTPDAVIIDLHMPGPSGFDLTPLLRVRLMARAFPLLVLTTSGTLGHRARAADLGVAGVDVKLLSFSGLVEIRTTQAWSSARIASWPPQFTRGAIQWSSRPCPCFDGLWPPPSTAR